MSAVLTQIRARAASNRDPDIPGDQAADEDRFEGYVFALVLQAARKEGAAIRLENRNSPFNS